MRAPSVSSVFLGLLAAVIFAASGYPQAPASSAPPPGAPAAASPTAASGEQDKVDAIRILYTGKTMGYFRIPDWQAPTATGDDCKDPARRKDRSAAAAEFDQLMQQEFKIGTTKGAILLSTGDNFSPEIEARDFCDPPPGQPGEGSVFEPVGKELFDWDANSQSWIRSDSHNAAHPVPANGLFMIPTDNIANFFLKEGYAAIVPGKQDFYFGPERVRELARFLATQPIPSNSGTLHDAGKGVQMLGANLVIETKWKTGHAPLPDSENPPWFIPRFPAASDLLGAAGSDAEIRMTGLTSGSTVYPWLRGVTLELSGANAVARLVPVLDAAKFYLCEVDANTPGNPNAIPQPVTQGPCTLLERTAGAKPTAFRLDFPWLDVGHFYTLHSGVNYGLCVVAPGARVKAADGSSTFCERFSVYMPFFHSSGEIARPACSDLQKPECYHDPDPYVLLETHDENGVPEDVAIFGVVDPQIGDNVGLLNFAWSNLESGQFSSGTSVREPAEALQQMLDSFDRTLDEKGYTQEIANGKRWLIRVLLAQMNPQEAQVLGTRLKQFQVIVSAADQELATVGNTENTEWNAPGAGSVRHPMMIEIPEPYFVGGRNPKAVDDIGRLDIHIVPAADPKWQLFAEHMELGKPADQPVPKNTAAAFWKSVGEALRRDCRLQDFDSQSQSEQIQILTLCEMQKVTHADVAILQERDFFADLPADAGDIPDLSSRRPENVLQQLLDRIIWKGDFLQLLNVPGSALQDAMKQSKLFDSADRSNLSLAEHRQRGLVSIGITYDPAHGEYLVNGVKLDPTQLYSVATSDFIGGGDTGYPDFAAAQVRPPMVPTDFDRTLTTISGTVCRGLAGGQWTAHCMGSIDRDTYLDEIAAAPPNTGPSNTPGETLRTWWIFHHPHPVPGEIGQSGFTPTLQNQVDQIVEFRPVWDFRVIRASFAFAGLGHNGSNADIDTQFGGITTPGVNSHTFDNWASNFQAQWTRIWQNYQMFAAPSYAFNVQYKGESNAPTQINQVANLGMFDFGFARLWAERGPEHRDFVIAAHFETPLEETNTVFALKSTVPSSLQFNQPRSYTTLLRAGFRWQRRVSSVEFGPEGGYQWDALEGFDFLTNGVVLATCPAESTLSFSTCVANASNPKKTNPPTITATSTVNTLLGQRAHAGMYWKINLTVPIYPRISYVFTDNGDWFFVNFTAENTTDTLFRDIEQHQLRLFIFPSLSIGPEVDLLFYENKTEGPLKGSFLRQDQVMMNAQFSFDLFNLRKKREQIEYAPASTKSQ